MNTVAARFRDSVFAVAIWGFTALFATGEFSTAALALCYGLTAVAWVMAGLGWRSPAWLWNILTLAAFAYCANLARASLLDASIYFFMFLQVAKLFSPLAPRDARWIYHVALFQVLGGAVLTTSVAFAAVFVVFVLLMSWSLGLFTMVRAAAAPSAETAAADTAARLDADRLGLGGAYPRQSTTPAPMDFSTASNTPTVSTVPNAGVTRGLAASSSVAALLLLLVTAAVFTVLPRTQAPKFFPGLGGDKRSAPSGVSAFDEAIQFGDFGKIQLDDRVAMYVRPAEADIATRPGHIRLRGVSLDTFDGRMWRRTTNAVPSDIRTPFVPFTQRVYEEQRSYTVLQPPGITNFLFADTFPETLRVTPAIQVMFDPLSNAAWLSQPQQKDLQYGATCRVEHLERRVDPETLRAQRDDERRTDRALGPEERRQARAEREKRRASGLVSAPPRMAFWGKVVLPEDYLEKLVAVPEVLPRPRLAALAQDWIRLARTDYQRALAIETRLRAEYRYSLVQSSTGNYIEDFLFRTREGHCEYFATAMAMLLRSVDIPARVVNGYHASEWNDIGSAFTVRQRDAHSWVEVYFGENYGWMTFDPTPPAGVGRPSQRSAAVQWLASVADALKVRWYRYIIDFGDSDRGGVWSWTAGARDSVALWLDRLSAAMSGGGVSLPDAPGVPDAATALLPPAAAAALAYAAWWAIARRRRRARAAARSTVPYYGEILDVLESHGHTREPGQTPREFAEAVAVAEPRWSDFQTVTDRYYSHKYGREKSATSQDGAQAFLRLLAAKTKSRPAEPRN